MGNAQREAIAILRAPRARDAARGFLLSVTRRGLLAVRTCLLARSRTGDREASPPRSAANANRRARRACARIKREEVRAGPFDGCSDPMFDRRRRGSFGLRAGSPERPMVLGAVCGDVGGGRGHCRARHGRGALAGRATGSESRRAGNPADCWNHRGRRSRVDNLGQQDDQTPQALARWARTGPGPILFT